MLTELCRELRNWFVRGACDIHRGKFTISGGGIQPISFLQDGQYFRIVGSVFNDGVWQYPAQLVLLRDEVFDGEVWAMRIPKEVVDLSAEIDAWADENANIINSPYQSESFGGYSYSLKSGSSVGGGIGNITWISQFASRLAKWRKL